MEDDGSFGLMHASSSLFEQRDQRRRLELEARVIVLLDPLHDEATILCEYPVTDIVEKEAPVIEIEEPPSGSPRLDVEAKAKGRHEVEPMREVWQR